MLVYEYKLDGNQKQFQAIEEAIRVVQFIRNKCLRLWMDGERVSQNDLQTYCAVLAREYPFAKRLNSQARQASADRAWFAWVPREKGVIAVCVESIRSFQSEGWSG